MKSITNNTDKVDVEEILKNFKVTNFDTFTSYLKEVWLDLAQRSDEKLKGINKLTFTSYYALPGIISDRLFAVLDKNQNGYLDLLEFLEGMRILFTESYDKVSQFIFDFYDFDKDGLISKEDIRTVLSYVTLSKEKKSSSESREYIDRVHSQEELHQILEKCFAGIKCEKIDYLQFLSVVENTNSDIYFFILLFLLEKKPFTKIGLSEYEKQKTISSGKASLYKTNTTFSTASPFKLPTKSPTKLVATPSSNSNFSPCLLFSKTPILHRKDALSIDMSNKDYINQLIGRGKEKSSTGKEPKTPSLSTFLKAKEKEKAEKLQEFDMSKSPKIPVFRKPKTNLKDLESQAKPVVKNIYNELPITPAFKQITVNKQPKTVNTKVSSSLEENLGGSSNNKIIISDVNMISNEYGGSLDPSLLTNDVEILSLGESQQTNTNSIDAVFNYSDSDEEVEIVKHEGYLYKMTESMKMKKLWFKLLHKDLYYFKSENETIHKGMHNLSGVFVKEEKPQLINNVMFFTFSVIYPKKVRYYYVENESEYKIWFEKLKVATGYANLNEIYEIKEKLGNGKFGLVRLGIHKQTGKKVAIKIMSKKDMNTQDLELVNTEIEILKICQHPNIIRLLEVFENVDYFYLIMEYCSGGDLFSYIEKRGFRLSEPRACQIMHKMCAALFYIHSYGIAHRDLKPENVLMTSSSDDADIRILDFGLSKIVGPGQNCNEPYGTLSYVAPEILLEQPYTKAVDMWSIGVTAYLLIAGCLPFDHETSEREIARQTIQDPVPYKGSVWKRTSPEAKAFIDNLLQKDPSKRMDIKQALEHLWFQKYCSKVTDFRRKSKEGNLSTFQLYSSTEEIL